MMSRGLKIFFSISFVLLSQLAQAQKNTPSKSNNFNENFIEELTNTVLNADNDEDRAFNNQQLKSTLEEVLVKKGAFSYPFNAVKSMSIICSPDSQIRIFNWNIPHDDGTFSYAAYLLKKQPNGDVDLIELTPIKNDGIELETFSGDKSHWPAALYYKLIQKEAFHKTYYTLLAWDGHNRLTSRKWIEVFWFNQAGKLQIGAPIFKNPDIPNLRRVVFRYSAQNTMNLNYRKDLDRIEFDHLSPSQSSLKGIYEYYGPDFSHDAYYWKGNYWEYKASINIEEGIEKRAEDFEVEEEVIQKQLPIYESKPQKE